MERKYNIACVTITMNDSFKIKEWYSHYLEYKDELFMHIIVDNNSEKEYLKQLKELFKDSIIIERSSNGGATSAYNDGLRKALSDSSVDFIALIANDIKIKPGSLSLCAEMLNNYPDLGMVEPVLLNKDSMVVCDFGCSISRTMFMKPYMEGYEYRDIKESIRYADAVTGGMNVSKRIFYEMVGLQDENIFMYSDEVDMGLRAKSKGFKLAAIRDAVSWHQHINENKLTDRRHPYNKYLIARNKIYLANKHFGVKRKAYVSAYFILISFYNVLKLMFTGKFILIKDQIWQLIGTYNGMIGNMKPNKYSHL